ncbi:MAG: helix-turn-helix domain-containing protein [Eubacteriales bacterium]|nr:helix-turn-helix domain-containing protein [Eubacteriales bacterium]
MEWMESISRAIEYIENHITEEISIDSIARQVSISPFYFQKGFSLLCGFTVMEYIRKRRLALAGSELVSTDAKVIDVALKYGYDSPDSFTKAFTRFHGMTPAMGRKDGVTLKSFAPLKIKISLEGGYLMDYKITQKDSFTVIGASKTFKYDNAKVEIPKFWNEHYAADPIEIGPEVRALTVLERSYLQTFPKSYKFEGSKSDMNQMIGNAVPINLAKFVADALSEYIADSEKETRDVE